ncbi:MAG: hypothetical protein HQL36_12545, partial [Alphaproteobacteria bacterium]|nr:hypothetical protein [Alphaproteobacteria bacterium]
MTKKKTVNDPRILGILAADFSDPFSFLGMHKETGADAGIWVRAFLPYAERVEVVDVAK